MTLFSVRQDLIKFQETHGVIIPLPLLEEAFTHPSYKTIDNTVKTYEQLETLGDSVIDLLVTKQLIEQDPEIEPGNLTQSRSVMVNNETLAKLGKYLGIDQLLRKSEVYEIGARDLANAVEALFGAIYINSGINASEAFFNQIKSTLITITKNASHQDYLYYNPIGQLQEFAQKRQLPLPTYDVINQSGPDHDPIFTISVSLRIEDKELEENAQGESKKKARIAAAALLLDKLSDLGLLN